MDGGLAALLGMAVGGSGDPGGTHRGPPWGVPVARFADGQVLYRVFNRVASPIGLTDVLWRIHSWDSGPRTVPRFLLMKGHEPSLSFGVHLYDSVLGVREIRTPFSLDPSREDNLNEKVWWTLVELFGIDIFDPRQFSYTLRSQIHAPKVVDEQVMSDLIFRNDIIVAYQNRIKRQSDIDGTINLTPIVNKMDALVELLGVSSHERWGGPGDESVMHEWIVFLGGAHQIQLSVEVDLEEVSFDWEVRDRDGTATLSSKQSSPLDALLKARMIVEESHEEEFLDQRVPEAELLVPPELLEPFELVDEPSPLTWPDKKLEQWAHQVGLVS